jgi:SAM-dependent methyltransferase
MVPHAAVYWDDIATQWRREQPHRLWRAHSDAINTALLKRWLPEGGVDRLLKTDLFDEVCGEGLYPLLRHHARSVFGIDVSGAAALAAKRRHPRLEGLSADVRRLPFADGTFDAIVSNSTLDHFEHADQIVLAVEELSRVLKSGGELILTLDNLQNPIVALRNALPFAMLNRLGITPYYVGATCGVGRLRRMIAQAGLQEMETAAVMHCPRVLGVAAARVLEQLRSPLVRSWCLRVLMVFESLGDWPSRFITGHFVAIKARKP